MDLAAKLAELRSASPQQLAQRAGAVLPPWVSLGLTLIVAWQIANLTWMLLPRGNLPVAALPGVGGARTAQADAPAFSIGDIVNAHLFGVVTVETVASDEPPRIDLPEETQLTLRGIIAAREPDEGLAIIAADRGNEKVYSVGDSIESGNGARVYQVYPDRVIVERGTVQSQLRLPREGEGTSGRTTTRRFAPSQPVAAQSGGARPNVSLRQAISQDPGRLTDIVRPQPVFANGQQRGYRVYPGRNRQQFARLGLQAGDLITEINGLALTDPQSGMEIFRTLGEGSGQVSVTVERNGQPEVLVLDTTTLASTLEESADEQDLSGDVDSESISE